MFNIPINIDAVETAEEKKPIPEEEEGIENPDSTPNESEDDESPDEEESSEEFLNYLKGGYDYFKDLGFLTDEDKEPKSEKEFLDLLGKARQREADTVKDAIFNSFKGIAPDYIQPVLELAIKGALTKEEFDKLIAGPKQIDFSDESVSESYLRTYFKDVEGYSEDEIDEEIEALKLRDSLTKKAEKIKKVQDGIDAKLNAKLLDDKNKEVKQREQQEVDMFNNIMQEIDNTKWQPKKIEQVKKSFTSNDFTTKVESAFSNPKVLPLLIDLMTYYDGKDLNLDKFITSLSNNKKVEKVEREVRKSYFKGRGDAFQKSKDVLPDRIDSITFK